MAQSFDSLFWASHASFHRRLQDGNYSKSALDDHFDWLLYGTQKFKPCNESSRKQILEKLQLEFKGKTFSYYARLRPLALRAARLLDLDEVQAMLLLKRWLKDNPDVKLDDLSENDPAALNDSILQVLRYYNSERILLLKCIQVVMLKAGETDEAGGALSDLLDRLIKSNIEEQLHARLRENLENGAAAITRRLKAGDVAACAPAAAAATGTAGAVSTTTVGFVGTAASLSWLSAASGEMRSQLVSERLELLNCLLLLYEVCDIACKPERAQALARLLLDRVFLSAQTGGAQNGAGGSGSSAAEHGIRAGGGADTVTLLSQQLAALLLMSCVDLPGHVRLAAAPTAAGAGAADATLPLGGKTMGVHNQISQYAATPATALLLLTWAGCLRLLDVSGGGHMIRDLDGATRELDGRVAAVGGLTTAVAALTALCGGAVGALLLVYRSVATKALCVLCTAFDLGADNVDPAMYEAVVALVKLCMEGDARACAALWDESQPATAPLRSLLASAARLFPAVPHHLLRLLRLTAASPDTARAAYAFLQRSVSLVVLHSASEPAIRHLGGGEVELTSELPWNLAPNVPGLVLSQGFMGTLTPLPAALSELRGRYVLVSWDAEISGGSYGQVLLLGRACHCVATLEHALLHNLPLERSDPTLLRDLSDTLSLLASLCSLEPSLLADLITQSVRLSSGTQRFWIDVVAGVLAIGPQLAASLASTAAQAADPAAATAATAAAAPLPPPLQLLADAAELLGAVAARSPGKVLTLLPQLQLLASPGGDLLAGLPPAVPLIALLSFTVPSCIDSFCGLLPALSALQHNLERPMGRYPLTTALLSLLALLLERGFIATPLPVAALFVLYEMLPNLHHWRYVSAKERWAVTRGSLRVVRLALTAGAYVSDPDISALAAPPPPKVAITIPGRDGSTSGTTLLLTYGGTGAGHAALSSAATSPEELGSASLSPDDIMRAAAPRLHVSVLSAALLKLLLLHGGVLLARCLPPPADVLERLRGDDPSRPELPLLEECAGEVVQLIPPLLAAAGVHPQEQPFEEFLFSGQDPTPASHVASYIAYHEADRDITPAEHQISYRALRALLSIAACVARPVSRSLPAVTLALAIPSGSPAEACLRALLRGDAAARHPQHHALSAQLAAEAVAHHAELLDALLFPSELEEEQQRHRARGGGGSSGGGGPPPLALPAPDGTGTVAAAGAVAVRRGPRTSRQALDGLYATLQQAAKLKQEQPEVLASSLRVLAAMWRQPAAAHRAVSVLRAAPALWSSLEACLEPVPAAAEAAPAHRALCEAFALQILTAEAFARARIPAAAAATGGGGPGSEVQAVLDRLVRGGGLLRLLRGAVSESGGGGGAGAAAATVAAAMGVGVVSGLWATVAVGSEPEPDAVSLGPAVREELSGIRSLLLQGAVTTEDIRAAHDDLQVAALHQPHLQQEQQQQQQSTHGSPTGTHQQSPGGDINMLQLPPTHPLAQLLQRQCLGAALVSRCHVATTDLAQLPGGPEPPVPGTDDYMLSRSRLVALLGPAAGSLNSSDLLTAALGDVNRTSSLGEALLAQLQAACMLTSVLAQDGKLLKATSGSSSGAATTAAALLDPPARAREPATPGDAGPSTSTAPAAAAGGGGGGLLTVVQSACWAAISGLLTWCDCRDSRATLQPDWGLRRLHALHIAAALSAARLLLSVLQSVRPVLTAPSSAPAAAAGSGGAVSTPARTPIGLGSVLGTPIAVTPVATGPRGSRQGAGGGSSTAAAAAGDGGGGVAADPAYLPFVVSLARQLAAWVRALVTSGLPQCPPAAAAQITDGLAGALLLALRPLLPESAVAVSELQLLQAGDRQQLAASLLSTIPQLCDLAASGCISTSLAAQLLLESTRHLATHDWLSLLLNHLDLGQHILAAASRAAALAAAAASGGGLSGGGSASLQGGDAAAAAGDLGMLTLALAVAQAPDGARALYDRGIVDQLVAAGRHLLSGTGGRLAAFSVIAVTGTGPYRPGVDGTYASTAGRSRFLGSGGPLLPDTCDVVQPLTLAGLVELEAALFLLGELTAYLGGWHMVLPASLLNFRTAVSTLLTWLAQPTLSKSFGVDCRPRTAREAALAATPAAGIPNTDGWFRACTFGTAAGGQAAGATAAAAGSNGGLTGGIGSPIAGAIPSLSSLARGFSEGLPPGMSVPVTPVAGGGLAFGAAATPVRAASGLGTPGGNAAGAGTAGPAATPGAAGSGGGGDAVCSEYSAEMAEKLYVCAQHALMFLVASSPQLSQGEAASLGPAWPRTRDLSALLDQCMCASESLAHAAITADTPGAATSAARRTRLMRLLARRPRLAGIFGAREGAGDGDTKRCGSWG
ncbi:hypothetical protein VOLCADRAFT_89091 [Volvox carteri f. nagariensis]|uniref:Uncharacterized protein n=1 Tax=Volvox carteri f. nagariensis TaxID=3068 RepID=D8TQS2_VOLCA|nr:uncharacterized protein VOLCADRAFT_89091 [Volvox carteri f. nagariensis]EFJ50204.1 hypothetical protein VOLCADRAFT_89091 [Volvox carteri f. nagariensis]|eukprot:XP_002948824.1 hypothetical protein VOLCADRAFT_89091 [Volvox carteri f. nagariensis]